MTVECQQALRKLLKALLECPSTQERELLREHSDLVDSGFAAFLTRAAEQAQKINNRQIWARIQYVLGLVCRYYLDNSAEQVEQAIAHYNQALQVWTLEAFPVEWATVQNDLGNAHRNRQKGEQKANLSGAIAYYHRALEVRQRAVFPKQWAATQYKLGVAYGLLSAVSQEDYLEAARICLEGFLEADPQEETDPQLYADTIRTIGTFYQESAKGHRHENLRQALRCYRLALAVYEREGLPESIAATQDFLGNVYRELSYFEDRDARLTEAIAAYQVALAIHSRERAPVDWAASKNDLGLVLLEGGQTEEALSCFQEALTVFNPTAFPLECSRVGKNLGHLAFREQLWTTAVEGYERAIAAFEVSRSRSQSDKRRQEILAEALPVYTYLIEAYIRAYTHLGQTVYLEKAIETIERSRSRYLVELMTSHDFYADALVPETIQQYLKQYSQQQQQLDELRFRYKSAGMQPKQDTIRSELRLGGREPELARTSGVSSMASQSEIQQLQAQLQQLETTKQRIWQQLRECDRFLAEQLQVEPIGFATLQALIDSPRTAILSFYSALNHTYIFVLRQNGICCHVCPGQSQQELHPWLKQEWFQPYLDSEPLKKQWIERMETLLAELAARLHLDKLVAEHLEGLEELILVPYQLLHLIPFAALPLVSGEYLGERFGLRTIPSCQILALCQQRQQVHPPFAYGTVVNTMGDLPWSEFEGMLVASLYDVPAHRRLHRDKATRVNYRRLLHVEKVQAVLSSHHAKFHPQNPLESELRLADSQLKLRELLSLGWRVPDLHEVFLSCCETGLGLPAPTDDLLTLGAGFLCSGARSAISSLWVVPDCHTALLSFFYHQARQAGVNRTRALQQAQRKLRHLSQTDVAELKQFRKQARERWQRAQNSETKELYENERKMWNKLIWHVELLIEPPPVHPFYWAAFTCQGLA